MTIQVMVAYIYNVLCDGLIDGIKDELVVDVLLVTQGRSCPSKLQVVIQLCIVTILSFKLGTPGKHTENDWTLGSAKDNPWVQSRMSLVICFMSSVICHCFWLVRWIHSAFEQQSDRTTKNCRLCCTPGACKSSEQPYNLAADDETMQCSIYVHTYIHVHILHALYELSNKQKAHGMTDQGWQHRL